MIRSISSPEKSSGKMSINLIVLAAVVFACLDAVIGQTNNQFVTNCPLVNADALVSSGMQILNQREGSYQTYIRAFFPYNPYSVPATAGKPPTTGSGYVGRVWSSGRLYSSELYPFSTVYHGANNAYSIPDAAMQDLQSNSELHFVGPQMYRYRAQNSGANGLTMQLAPGYPKMINTTMRGAPTKIDASLQLHPQMYFLINDAKKEGYYYTELASLKATLSQNNPVNMNNVLQESGITKIQAALNYQGNLWVMYQNSQGQHWFAKLAYTPPYQLRLLSKVPAVSKPNAPVGVMTCAV